ncbi:hypothetical protein CE91St1_39240 [Parabacteroides goldsteinii]|jgi:hypothetical protein|nr:hypothetical protein CE91St1_39240 [Parabacteroides goldsteinii]GKG81813.1 hypothetical protein CE91St2_50050 [Parabacteroides goldsteinii]
MEAACDNIFYLCHKFYQLKRNLMTKIQEYLAALPEDEKALFIPVFGSVDKFYTVVYLIIRNEHVTDQEKPERYEDRLQVIRQVKNKVEELVSSYGLDGKEIVADIASDYFEDFVNYKEPEPDITNEEFIAIIRKL